MPLNTDVYLKKRGWLGHGWGLRQDGLSKPLVVAQRKSLSGLGKDRDEAYPFWDHLFTAASKTINIRIHTDDQEKAAPHTLADSAPLYLQKTRTGIVSSLRPSQYGSDPTDPTPPTPRPTLVVIAKQEAARKQLYSHFYRGANLTPDSIPLDPSDNVTVISHRGESAKLKKRKRKSDVDGPSTLMRPSYSSNGTMTATSAKEDKDGRTLPREEKQRVRRAKKDGGVKTKRPTSEDESDRTAKEKKRKKNK